MASIFKVDDIHCQGCADRIKGAIQKAVPGAAVTVDIAGGKVQVLPGGDAAKITKAIETAGYKVASAS